MVIVAAVIVAPALVATVVVVIAVVVPAVVVVVLVVPAMLIIVLVVLVVLLTAIEHVLGWHQHMLQTMLQRIPSFFDVLQRMVSAKKITIFSGPYVREGHDSGLPRPSS